MTLMAAFMTLLHRVTGQRDVAVGTPIANRNRHQLEDLIGFFANTLVLRADLSPVLTRLGFRELLARVREAALGAYGHQELPFEKLVEELQPERDLARNPLFQALFTRHNAPVADLSLAGLRCTPVELNVRRVRFELELHLWQLGDRLEGAAIYNRDLFDPTTIRRWISGAC